MDGAPPTEILTMRLVWLEIRVSGAEFYSLPP